MRLIIAEKPSVARDIARVIGANEQKEIDNLKYYQNSEYIVSNFRGHLVGLAEPDDYFPNLKSNPANLSAKGKILWSNFTLPILPENYTFKPNEGCFGHIKALGKLMQLPQVTEIVNAADAGREGELIFRYVYNYLKCNKPTKRLWISSLTDESIENGIRNLINSDTKNGMYWAGDCRNKADWLFGMNLTIYFSTLYHGRIHVGRVQTPTLRMVVDRDIEIKNFKKSKYYTLCLNNGAEYFVSEGENTFKEKSKADSIANFLNGKTVTVKSVESKKKSENRPQLFNITTAQIEANEKYGFTAEETTSALQKLYEKKLTTYPRTDSSYITQDMVKTIPDIVQKVEFFAPERVKKLQSKNLNLDNRIVDDKKVSDHHAIIPTKEIEKLYETGLSETELIIAKMVIHRFLLALDQPYFYDETKTVFSVENYNFKLTSKVPLSLGWREYEPFKNDKNTETEPVAYSQGQTFPAVVKVTEKETSPPKPFTEATLLSAMENISRRIEDKEKAEFVKERGLGTPATRSGIIQKLVDTKCCERKGKTFISTEMGKQVIGVLPENVKNVEMTAEWEEKLADIENGKLNQFDFLNNLGSFVKEIINTVGNDENLQKDTFKREVVNLGKCPKCGKEVRDFPKSYRCEDKECEFVIWKVIAGANISQATAKKIIAKGKSDILKFKSKSDKIFSAKLALSADKTKIEFEFINKK
jgi:DNA topoisomerase-3